jgi:hypothetical protein
LKLFIVEAKKLPAIWIVLDSVVFCNCIFAICIVVTRFISFSKILTGLRFAALASTAEKLSEEEHTYSDSYENDWIKEENQNKLIDIFN